MSVELARQIGILVGGVLVTALVFEMLDAKAGDIKAWVKSRLNDTTFINKVNTVVENSITKLFSKADQYALLSGKVEKVLESLKTNLSEEAFQYLKTNLQKDQISDLMEAVRKLEKELGSTEIKLSEAQVKKLLEGLKDGKSVDSMVAELKTWCEKYDNTEFIKELEAARASDWIKPDGSTWWPPNRGYEEIPETIVLEPGTLVDRYGYDGGNFVSPKGTSYTKRALPKGSDTKPYTVFEVIEPVEVQSGKIAAWFGEKGGGIQFEFSKSIKELLKENVLRKVE